ncbi:unnamed protein product [Adineta steineri]|uniref:Uncharacterized protein n=1 Tax=Adineta steineri TaxID=433720 RepID=A0A814B754_9BILA|nr:unnamed protein product [Adineta steineri]CAF3921362.1 unnamed protein product [Adineta steineri]
MGAAIANLMYNNEANSPENYSGAMINQQQSTAIIPPRRQPTIATPHSSAPQTHTQRPYRMYYNPRSGPGYIGPRLPHLIEPQVRVYY